MACFDQADYDRAIDDLDESSQRIDVAPTVPQRLGPFTVVCLVLNRTIGSGIFVAPSKVLAGTGSVGASLLLWGLGGPIATCGLLVWLELGLSVPLRLIPGTGERKNVPRSGGEKNYLEFIFPRPTFLVTCMYGIVYIIAGNLSGNAIAFGNYVMIAANHPNASRADIIGVAIAALSVAVLLHVCSRRGGIIINNLFTVVKVLILIAIIIMGFDCYDHRHNSFRADMATLFFAQTFGDEAAQRVMAALIAFSIVSNIVVMTFTSSRVKQEIAKEGVLPFSLFFATSHTTPWAWLKAKWHSGRKSNVAYSQNMDDRLEQSPMAALGLHWLSSVFLIAVTSMLDPTTSYSVLVSLYSYVVNVLNGFIVSGGLLYLKLDRSRSWSSEASFKPWIDPLHAVIYFVVCGFLLFATFAKPSGGTPYSDSVGHIQWFIMPAIGLSTLSWGLIWYLGLKLVMLQKRKQLVVTRVPFIVPDEKDPGQWVQKSELVDHEWHTKVPSLKPSLDGHEMT